MCKSGARPGQRDAHEAVYFPNAQEIVVYGGDNAPFNPMAMTPSVYTDEVWGYGTTCGTFTDLVSAAGPSGPGQRGAYAATLDSKRQRMIVIGGRKHDAS